MHFLRRGRAVLSLLALVTILTHGLAPSAFAQGASPNIPLELQFLDVGEGDAILIRLGHLGVLVDAGRGDDIVRVLQEQGIDSLVAVIASLNRDDHIGGMDAVLADFPVGRYLSNGRPPENYDAQKVEYWLGERGVDVPNPPWEPIELGDARITVFPSRIGPGEATENTSSLGVLVERGAFRALLTGDSEVEELNAWLAAGIIPDVDVLKAADHGARDGVTPEWLEATKPEAVVISVGSSNTDGHPDPWALRDYGTHHRKVYRTDRDGTVIVMVDRRGRYGVRTLGPIMRQ